MKTKNKGFTALGAMLVMTFALNTFAATTVSYKSESRDDTRKKHIVTMAMMFRVDGATNWENNKYVYTKEQLEELFVSNDYRAPAAENGICYFIAMGAGSLPIGDDNQFLVATWGEGSSSDDYDNGGVIYDGMNTPRERMAELNLTQADFACNERSMRNIWKQLHVNASGEEVLGSYTDPTDPQNNVSAGWFWIDKAGVIQPGNPAPSGKGLGVKRD